MEKNTVRTEEAIKKKTLVQGMLQKFVPKSQDDVLKCLVCAHPKGVYCHVGENKSENIHIERS